MRVFSYSRVSSDEQARDGNSLEIQRAEHENYARIQKLTIHPSDAYSDVMSGSKEKEADRKGQIELLARIEPGDMLIISKIDRWSRDLPFAVSSIRDLVSRNIIVRATSDSWRDAKSDDSIIGIMAWSADQERKRIWERMVGTRIRLRSSGKWMQSGTPIGYSVDPATLHLVPNDEAVVVRTIFELAIAGRSYQDIGEVLRAQYPRKAARPKGELPTGRLVKWEGTQIRKILNSRIYLGEICPNPKGAPDEWIANCHPAIVTPEEFASAKKAVEDRTTRPRGTGIHCWTRNHVGRDLVRCARCGYSVCLLRYLEPVERAYYFCSMRATRRKRVPHANCSGVGLRVDLVDGALIDLLKGRIAELRNELIAGDMANPESRSDAGKGRDVNKEIEKVQRKRNVLLEQYQEGDIAKPEYKKRLAKLDAEVDALRRELESTGQNMKARDPETRKSMVEVLERMARVDFAPDLARETLIALAHRVTLDAAPSPGYRQPARPIVAAEWRTVAELVRALPM